MRRVLEGPMRPDLWNLLSPEDMGMIHRKTMELLQSPGLHIDHDGFISALEARGAKVNRSARQVRIPAELTERAVTAMAGSPCLLKDDLTTVEETRKTRVEQMLREPLQFRFGGSGLEVLGEDLRTPRTAGRYRPHCALSPEWCTQQNIVRN